MGGIKMAKSKELTLSDVGFGNKVLINGHVYTYKGQDKRRTSGGTKTVYIFKMVETSKIAEEFLKLTAADGIGLQKVSFPMGVFIDDCDSNVKLKTLAENGKVLGEGWVFEKLKFKLCIEAQ